MGNFMNQYFEFTKEDVDDEEAINELKTTTGNIGKNIYASVLKILGGCIMALGILGSFILGKAFEVQQGYTYVYYEYNYYLMFVGVISSVVTGTLIMGMGELIRIAHETSEYTRLILKQIKPERK